MKRSVNRLRRVESYCLLRALDAATMRATNWWADRHAVADHELNMAIAHSCDRGALLYMESNREARA